MSSFCKNDLDPCWFNYFKCYLSFNTRAFLSMSLILQLNLQWYMGTDCRIGKEKSEKENLCLGFLFVCIFFASINLRLAWTAKFWSGSKLLQSYGVFRSRALFEPMIETGNSHLGGIWMWCQSSKAQNQGVGLAYKVGTGMRLQSGLK